MNQTKMQILTVLADQWRQSLNGRSLVIINDHRNAIEFYLKLNANDLDLEKGFKLEFNDLMKKVLIKQNDEELSWINL